MLTKTQKEQLKYDTDRTNLDMDEIAPLLCRIINGLPENPEPIPTRVLFNEIDMGDCAGCKYNALRYGSYRCTLNMDCVRQRKHYDYHTERI